MGSVDCWPDMGRFSIFLAGQIWVGSAGFWSNLCEFSISLSILGLIHYAFDQFLMGSIDYWPNLGGFSSLMAQFGWVQ